jgi:hypothetical protein
LGIKSWGALVFLFFDTGMLFLFGWLAGSPPGLCHLLIRGNAADEYQFPWTDRFLHSTDLNVCRTKFDMAAKRHKKHTNKISGLLISMGYNE